MQDSLTNRAISEPTAVYLLIYSTGHLIRYWGEQKRPGALMGCLQNLEACLTKYDRFDLISLDKMYRQSLQNFLIASRLPLSGFKRYGEWYFISWKYCLYTALKVWKPPCCYFSRHSIFHHEIHILIFWTGWFPMQHFHYILVLDVVRFWVIDQSLRSFLNLSTFFIMQKNIFWDH